MIEDLSPAPEAWRGACLSIGNFDGVHRGHAQLVGRLRQKAARAGVPAVVLTFDPHPVALLRPYASRSPLTRMERTALLLEEAGADEVGIFRTGPWLLELTAREFFEQVLLGLFGARGLVEGPTFGFGRDRGGDVEHLGRWCEEEGIEFEVVGPLELAGGIVSSTRIREALREGEVELAGELLGRPHRLEGIVGRGARRGAALGFPTANLEGIDVQVPEHGVYCGRVRIGGQGKWWGTATHIGPNVTFGAQEATVEAHLLDFDGDIYGEDVELDIMGRLRPTMRFDGVEALKEQMHKDVQEARRRLREGVDRSSGQGAS